jgi:uncharacterized protein (TIGR02453 family)
MTKISPETLSFLSDLKLNNNRDWFNDNKPRYEIAKTEFEGFVDSLIRAIAEFDSAIGHHTAKECIFRIYRDVRFSHDKSPYKTHFGAFISAFKAKSEIHSFAGYYVHIEPSGGSFLAGGAYVPQGPWLKSIREEINYNGDELISIVNNAPFKEYFGAIEGEKLKTTPKDYPADHPHIELLKHKSFLADHKLTDKMVLSGTFLKHATAVFNALYPLNRFLNMARD